MKQTAILVLGMHRSGTSALTGLLSYLGIELGSELLVPKEDNKKGFFENKKIVKINDKILEYIDSYWHDVFFSPNLLNNLSDILKLELKKIIQTEFKSEIFAIKDPRLCYIFPVYKEVLNELNIDIKILIPFRNPYEVAISLQKRNKFSLEKSIMLWLKHLSFAYKFSKDFDREFVYFDDLLKNPKLVAEILTELTDKDFIKVYNSKKEIINSFLESNLKTSINIELPSFLNKVFTFLKEKNFEEFEKLIDMILEMENYFYHKEIKRNIKENKILKNYVYENKNVEKKLDDISKENKFLKEQINNLFNFLEKELKIILDENETFRNDIIKLKEIEKKNSKILKEKLILEKKIKKILEENKILKTKNERYRKENEELKNKVNKLINNNNSLKEEIAMYYLSNSWRITRPLRKIKKVLKNDK